MAKETQVANPKAARSKEMTGAQLLVASSLGDLTNPLPKSYDSYRTIRRHPSVRLARDLKIAPIALATWSVEAKDDADDEMVKLVQDDLLSLREVIVERALEGMIDFGWQTFETVYGLREQPSDAHVHLLRVKDLLHDITEIRIDGATGQLNGFKQQKPNGEFVTLPIENALHFARGVEGANWYGESLLEGARLHYNDWVEANAGAKRYDRKMAGSHWVIKYPVGTSDFGGVTTDNATIARAILGSLESSGSAMIPKKVTHDLEDLNEQAAKQSEAWEIDLVSDTSGHQPDFVTRLAYLDKLLVRSLIMPERAIMEGQFGTKAEAGAHADIALSHMELVHRHLTRLVNWHCVDRLLALNFGEESRGMVWLSASPLADEAIGFLRTVYIKLLEDGVSLSEEKESIDLDAMKDKLGIPKSEEVTAGKEQGTLPRVTVDDGLDDDALGAMDAA